MSYPKQASVSKRLQDETIKAHDALAKDHLEALAKLWHHTSLALRGAIYAEYRNHFKDRWNLIDAKKMGTLIRIERKISHILNEFKDGSKVYVRWAIEDIYRHAIARQAWILDQVTPQSLQVKIPSKRRMHESDLPDSKETVDWSHRWDTWIDAYFASLNNNIKLGAMNDTTADEAAAEVDQTKAGSPMYSLWDSLQRIFAFEAQGAFTGGQDDVAQANANMVEEEIWQTRYNIRVCDICIDMQGKTVEQADQEGEGIPAHPNCNCYWEVVPKAWADLLRSGNPEDQKLAIEMEARGLVHTSMNILDENGDLLGSAIVTFKEWLQGSPMAVSGQ